MRLAAELLSHTTATALLHFKPGNDPISAENVGNFVNIVNEWFDLFNSYTAYHKIPTKCAYGVNLDEQQSVLLKFTDTVENMPTDIPKRHNYVKQVFTFIIY